MLQWMAFLTRLDHLSQKQTILWIGLCCVLLLLLWFPALAYPTWADTAYYALLGENLWKHGAYALDGIPHAKFLPFHALYSYPFVAIFGYGTGMKVATLVAGWGVIIASYFLLKETISKKVGLIVAAFLSLQPGFLLTAMLGSSDQLFAALILSSAYFFVRAKKNPTMYVWSGILLGLACLTRYNGAPVFAIYALWILFQRRRDLMRPWSWAGFLAGIVIFTVWFLRNALVFGNPLHTEYTVQRSADTSLIDQMTQNMLYYLDPLHSILPILFLLALWGIFRCGRKHSFLILYMMGATALALIWWAHGARYLVPILPILLAFSVLGFEDVFKRTKQTTLMISVTAGLLLISHIPVLCAYDYGSCNAWMDRTIGILPKTLGVSPEGMTAWNEAKDFVNAHAKPDATVNTDLDAAEITVLGNTFRPDLHITERRAKSCAAYRLTQLQDVEGAVLFESITQPTARVMEVNCS